MMATSLTTRAALGTAVPRILAPVGAFLAGLGPVVLLGFNEGGYEVSVVAGYGVLLWWLLLVGILTGTLPRPRPTRAGIVALAAIVLLAIWGAISLGWSASSERGLTEVVRLVVVGGSLLLGLSAVAGGQPRPLVGGVLTGLSAIAAAGVLSRLQPETFSGASAVSDALGVDRLSWPLNYWNGMGAVAALALPLGVVVAARARTRLGAGLAAAGLPVVVLCLAMTLSRGGIAAAIVGLAATVAFVAPRLVVLRTMLAPAVGAAVLVAAYLDQQPLVDAVGGTAQGDAGRDLLPLVVLVTLGVGLVQAGWNAADRARWTPRTPRPGPRTSRALLGSAAVVAVVLAAAALTSDRASRAWDDFRDPDTSALRAAEGSTDRLSIANGAGRYEEWSGAVRALRENPLGGIGLGSWQDWWSPRRETSPAVRNAHSEPLEIAAELGAPGALLFLLIVLTPVVAGLAALRRREPRYAVVALPTATAFLISISVDWAWQLSVVPVAVALLAAASLGRANDDLTADASATDRLRADRRRLAALLTTAVLSVGSLGVLAVAMIAPEGVERSQAAASSGALDRAAGEARRAQSAAPFALSAVLQRAIVAEQAGDLDQAAAAAREATTVEPRNWRPWMVLARIEARRDRPRAAVGAYRRAKALNPRSELVNP